MINKGRELSQMKSEIRGCIDLGSSYFRLLVVEGIFPGNKVTALRHTSIEEHSVSPRSERIERNHVEVISVTEDRRYVGWGDDLESIGEISQARSSDAWCALEDLASLARRYGCEKPIIVGTNTLRVARNARAITDFLAGKVSAPISILSQEEEAAMSFLGACSALAGEVDVILLDIGGTSTEVSWGKGGRLVGFLGMPWGTHRVCHVLRRSSPPELGLHRALLNILEQGNVLPREGLLPHITLSHLSIRKESPTILATGGTAVSLAVALRFMKRSLLAIGEIELLSEDDLVLIGRRVEGILSTGRERSFPLSRERMRLLLPGFLLLSIIFREIGSSVLHVTSRDLRWGILMSAGEVFNP